MILEPAKGQECRHLAEGLREPGLFRLVKGKLMGDYVGLGSCWNGGCDTVGGQYSCVKEGALG